MKYVLRKGFPGGRNATAAAQIVILLSDGRSQGNVLQAATELKETGVVLFAVGLRYPRYGGLFCCNNSAIKFLFLSAVHSLKKSFASRWEELHVVASEPMESHVFFAEHFYDAVNGLYTTLSTFSVCNATPQGERQLGWFLMRQV